MSGEAIVAGYAGSGGGSEITAAGTRTAFSWDWILFANDSTAQSSNTKQPNRFMSRMINSYSVLTAGFQYVDSTGSPTRGQTEQGRPSVCAHSCKHAVMETNYFGVLRCIKSVVRQMRERRSGTIINVSSVAGTFSQPSATPYCDSKWALEALSEGLACEMKPFGVRVSIVEPGIIDTAMAQRIRHIESSIYPHAARIATMFKSALANAPVPPNLVAQKILEIAQSNSWQLRYPVGPDGASTIAWRKTMTDEQWVDLHSADDETFQRLMGAS
jgi:NAD(P)-dependent dehydrogenase (short-subunit alcohol dehydrogenase family)